MKYHELVVAKHPIIAPLATHDHVGNAFVKAFGSRPDHLHHCNMVVKHMLLNEPFRVLPSKYWRTVKPQQGGKPTVQTWSILLHSYMKHGHNEAAEKVMTMMRKRGIEPDLATWNQIIAGFVRQQDVINVVKASKKLKDAGFEFDGWTIRALRRLRNKNAYFQGMESISGFGTPSTPES